ASATPPASPSDDLSSIVRRHQLDALIVMDSRGPVLRTSGDAVTCRALAAYATSAEACGCDGAETERSCCGRVCVARRTLDGRELLVAALARSAVRAAEEVIDAAMRVVCGDAGPDASGVFVRLTPAL
ncbi:MAG: hypothetical protein ACHREM_27175, partial [Polyangiales bacterium]